VGREDAPLEKLTSSRKDNGYRSKVDDRHSQADIKRSKGISDLRECVSPPSVVRRSELGQKEKSLKLSRFTDGDETYERRD